MGRWWVMRRWGRMWRRWRLLERAEKERVTWCGGSSVCIGFSPFLLQGVLGVRITAGLIHSREKGRGEEFGLSSEMLAFSNSYTI